jgi:hypothetical protein
MSDHLGAKPMQTNETPFPLIRKEDYDAFLAIPTADIPKTFDEWQQGIAAEHSEFIRTGTKIISVPIYPQEFAHFCLNAGITANLDSLQRFTAEKFRAQRYP